MSGQEGHNVETKGQLKSPDRLRKSSRGEARNWLREGFQLIRKTGFRDQQICFTPLDLSGSTFQAYIKLFSRLHFFLTEPGKQEGKKSPKIATGEKAEAKINMKQYMPNIGCHWPHSSLTLGDILKQSNGCSCGSEIMFVWIKSLLKTTWAQYIRFTLAPHSRCVNQEICRQPESPAPREGERTWKRPLTITSSDTASGHQLGIETWYFRVESYAALLTEDGSKWAGYWEVTAVFIWGTYCALFPSQSCCCLLLDTEHASVNLSNTS